MEESPTCSTSVLEGELCPKCCELQKEVDTLKKQETFFLTLKTKIIKTDALIKKYMSKSQEAEEQEKKLELLACENAVLTQNYKVLEEELKKTIKETLPWKLSKDKFAAEMEEIRKQLENTQIKLSASESLCLQYEQKIESTDSQEAEHILTIRSLREELRHAELRCKAESQKLMKAKQQAVVLRQKLSERNSSRRRKSQSTSERSDDNPDMIGNMSGDSDEMDDSDEEEAVNHSKPEKETSQRHQGGVSTHPRLGETQAVEWETDKSIEKTLEENIEEDAKEEGTTSPSRNRDSQSYPKDAKNNLASSKIEDEQNISQSQTLDGMQSIGKEDDKNSEGDSSDSDGDFDEMRPSLFDEDDIEVVERAGLEKTQENRETISANATSDLFGELIDDECKEGIQTSSESEESLEAGSVERRDQRELDSDVKSIKEDIKSVKEKDKQNNNLNKGGDHSSNRYTVESKNYSQRNVTSERDKIDSRKGNELESADEEDALGEKVLEKEVGEHKQKLVDGYELGESYKGGRTRISRVAPVEDDNEMSDSSGDCGISEGKNEEKMPSIGKKQCERHHDSSTTREEKKQRDSGEQCTTMDSHMTDSIKQRERTDGTSREISDDEVYEEEDARKCSHQRYKDENDQLQRKGNMKVSLSANKVERQRELIIPDKDKNSYTGREQSQYTISDNLRERLNRDKEIVDRDDEMRCSNNGNKEPLQEQRLVKEDSKKQEERQRSDSSEEEAGLDIEISNSVAGKSRTARSSSSKVSGLQSAEGDKLREPADGMSKDASASSSEWMERSELCEQSTVKKHSVEGVAVTKLKAYLDDSKQRERSNPPNAGKSCQTVTLEKLKIVCPKESEASSEKVEVESAGFESLELDNIMITERIGSLTTPTKQKIVVKNVTVVPSRERASFTMPENHVEVPQRRISGVSLEPMIASILDSLPVITRVLSPIPLSPARGGIYEGEEEEEEEDDNELNLHQRRLSPLSPPDASCFLPPFSASERALSPLPRTPVPPEDYPEHGGDAEPSEVIMTNFHAVVPEGVINVRPQAVPSFHGGVETVRDTGGKRKHQGRLDEMARDDSREVIDVRFGKKSRNKKKKRGLSDSGDSDSSLNESGGFFCDIDASKNVGSLSVGEYLKKTSTSNEQTGRGDSVANKVQTVDSLKQGKASHSSHSSLIKASHSSEGPVHKADRRNQPMDRFDDSRCNEMMGEESLDDGLQSPSTSEVHTDQNDIKFREDLSDDGAPSKKTSKESKQADQNSRKIAEQSSNDVTPPQDVSVEVVEPSQNNAEKGEQVNTDGAESGKEMNQVAGNDQETENDHPDDLKSLCEKPKEVEQDTRKDAMSPGTPDSKGASNIKEIYTTNDGLHQNDQKIVFSEVLKCIGNPNSKILNEVVKMIVLFLDQNPVDLLLVQLSKSFVQNRSSRPVLTSQEEEILAEVKKRKGNGLTNGLLETLVTFVLVPKLQKVDEKTGHTKRLTYIRMYAAVCRLKGLAEQLRVLCFDLVIRRIQFWEELLLCVASVWPAVLTRKPGNISQPIIDALELVTWKSLTSKKSNAGNSDALWQCLKFSCNWNDPIVCTEELMAKHFLTILNDEERVKLMNDSKTSPVSQSSFETVMALEMLAWSRGWKWTWSFLIVENIWPALVGLCKATSMGGGWKAGRVCFCLKVLGTLGQVERQFHMETFNLIEKLSDFLKYTGADSSTQVPAVVVSHAAGAILSLSESWPAFAAQTLRRLPEGASLQLIKGDRGRLDVLMETCKGVMNQTYDQQKYRDTGQANVTKRSWHDGGEGSKKCARGRKKFRR